ncbi:hypothetical protein ACFFX0_01100 [Citricoccus parietis]|uniref:Uncharacterized protein n=1 Tax=Citricoccus parietis TaxID=592307 RepID=A0ABV5FT55_9MICC
MTGLGDDDGPSPTLSVDFAWVLGSVTHTKSTESGRWRQPVRLAQRAAVPSV